MAACTCPIVLGHSTFTSHFDKKEQSEEQSVVFSWFHTWACQWQRFENMTTLVVVVCMQSNLTQILLSLIRRALPSICVAFVVKQTKTGWHWHLSTFVEVRRLPASVAVTEGLIKYKVTTLT